MRVVLIVTEKVGGADGVADAVSEVVLVSDTLAVSVGAGVTVLLLVSVRETLFVADGLAVGVGVSGGVMVAVVVSDSVG